MIAKSHTSAEEALDHLNDPAADAPPRVEVPADTRTRAQLDEQIAKTEAAIARTHRESPVAQSSGDEPAMTIGRVALARLRKLREKAQDVAPPAGSIVSIGAARDGRVVDIVITEDAVNSILGERSSARMQPAPKPNRLLTRRDVLERISVAPQTLDRWEAEGKFPQRIPLPDVDEAFWLEREIDAWTGDVKSRDPEKETG